MTKVYKILVLSLAVIMLITALGPIGVTAAGNSSVNICYDGKPLTFSNPNCFIQKDGYYLAPAQELASLTGWSTEVGTASVKFTNEALDLVVQANAGVKKFIINGHERTSEGAPELINGVMMVPVKDFFYAMNCSVKFEDSTGTFIVDEPLAKVTCDKDVIAHKAQAAPVIDGKADDAAWAGAEENGGFTTVFYNEKPQADTKFKVTYDDTAVYFFVYCEGKPVPLEGVSVVLAPAAAIGSSTPFYNAVLIPEPDNTMAIGTDRPGGLYVQYRLPAQEHVINENGRYGTDITAADPYEKFWVENGFDAEYVVNDTSWTAEVKIPYDKLVASAGDAAPTPASLAQWRLNVARVRPFTEGVSSWAPIRNSLAYDNHVGDIRYTVDLSFAPATGSTGSIFFEGYPETDVFGTPMPYLSVVPRNAGMRYMGYDIKMVFFDKTEDLSDTMDFNVKKSNFRAEWVDQLGVKYQAEILKITEKDSRIYFIVKHPDMPNDGLYRLNIYIDKDNYNGNGKGKATGKTTGEGNRVKKYEMMFDREQVMDAGVIYNSYAVSTAVDKKILTNTNLKEKEQSDAVKKLISIIPHYMGCTTTSSPVGGSFKYNYASAPNTLNVTDSKGNILLSVTKTAGADGTATYTTTPEKYKDNRSMTVTTGTGKQMTYGYYEDQNGNKYFLDEQLDYQQCLYLNGQLSSLASSDPLGAAWVLYEMAKAYQDWMPTCDYFGSNYPFQLNWGPPYFFAGGLWPTGKTERPFSELGQGMKDYADAYGIVRKTNALDIVSDQAGENAEDLLVNGMFKKELEYIRTYPEVYMNYEYYNWIGETALGKAMNEPEYIHEVVDTVTEYVQNYSLLDGFWKEVTLSYHTQSLAGTKMALDALKGWSDPVNYVSPRNVKNVQNLDMYSKLPVLNSANLMENTVVYPSGRYYPIQDTWESGKTSSASPNMGSILLPAANIARMSKGTGANTSQLYMTYAPQYGSHYHYDPLSLGLWSNGQELLPDLGYTHTQLHSWAVSTMGHNTVVVDSKDAIQPVSANYGGKVENYSDIDSTVQIMKAGEENAYPGLTSEYDREPWYIKMEGSNDSYVLDIFRVNGGNSHEYTLNGDGTSAASTFTANVPMTDYNTDTDASNNDTGRLLPTGTKVTLPAKETETGSAEYNGQKLYYGYIPVKNVKKADLADGKYEITLATKDNKNTNTASMKITGFAGENSQLFIGQSPSLSGMTTGTVYQEPVKYCPKMVVRRQGEEGKDLQSTFVNVMESYAAGSSAKIKAIEKLATSNPEDVAMKISYTTATGDITDVLISSSNSSVPLTVSDATLGEFTMTGKMAFIRYLRDQNGVYQVAKVYTVETGSIDVNGQNISGSGKIEGNVVKTMRKANGDNMDAFVVNTTVPDSAIGKTMTITHPDGSVHAFEVTSVTPDGSNTIVGISGGDPGFDMFEDGSSLLRFYPNTKWNGVHTLKIAMDTTKDYGLTKAKQGATFYTTQERQNAKDNIAKGYPWAIAAENSAVTLADTYAAKSNDELWNMVTQENLNTDMKNGLQALSEAYIYTGNVSYAKAGLILLDRIADIYPGLQLTGSNEECSLEQTMAKAYDAFYPEVNNAELITFLADKAKANNLKNPKASGDLICINIENGIIRQIRVLSEKPEMMDNYAMQQAALVLAAVVLDSPSETNGWLDFAFKAAGLVNGKVTGGDILPSLVNNADRDGMGNQGSTAYNKLWADSLTQIADALDGYGSYTRVNLYQNPAFIKTLSAFYPLSSIGKYTIQAGDSTAAVTGPLASLGSVIKGYEKTGDAVLAQYAYYLNDNKFDGLHSDIFTASPESVKDSIAQVVGTYGELNLDSSTMPGYGFSILRDGSEPYKELRSSTSFNNMTKDSSNPNTATKYFSSNGATQLEVTSPYAGQSVAYLFQIPEDGIYRIDVTPYTAGSYGSYDIYVDGVKQLSYNFYGSGGANSGVLNIMTGTFTAGTHTIKFVCTGKIGSSTGYKMGVISFIATQIINQDDTRRDVWMYYGNTQPLHSHKDQLNLGVHAYGLDMAPDLVTTSSNDWGSGTISHNTVVVDNSDQQPSVEGTPLYFDNSGDVQVMDVESDKAYQQTQLYRRSEVMVKVSDQDSYSVDFFRVKGGNDQTYSFHSLAGAVYTEGLDLVDQASGIADQPLVNVRKDANPSSNFSVDYSITDERSNDAHLRLTMLGKYNDVSIGDYAYGDAGNPTDTGYVLAHRTGSNLESVFTSVIEPYKGSRYIQSIEEAVVTKDGVPVSDMEARAVKVTLTNGRTDYIISAISNVNTYVIDGKISFKGIEGVYSIMNGTAVINYVNDGTVIGDKVYDTGAVTGTVTGFTQELSSDNRISVKFDKYFDASLLVGRYINIKNDGVQNGIYQIKGVVSQNENDVTFDIGETSVIRSYIDSNYPLKGFVYNVAEGEAFTIPLGNITSAAQ